MCHIQAAASCRITLDVLDLSLVNSPACLITAQPTNWQLLKNLTIHLTSLNTMSFVLRQPTVCLFIFFMNLNYISGENKYRRYLYLTFGKCINAMPNYLLSVTKKSVHCSYKSSAALLGQKTSTAPFRKQTWLLWPKPVNIQRGTPWAGRSPITKFIECKIVHL